MNIVKKAILPMAGLGTRFLPLSKVLRKEIIPILDKPLFYYSLKEAVDSGIKEIILVLPPKKDIVLDYFKNWAKIEKILKLKKREKYLKDVREFRKVIESVSIKYVIQKKPLGDGNAVLMAEEFIKDEPVAVLFIDDIIRNGKPAISQLIEIAKTGDFSVIGLKEVEKEKIPNYGIVEVEKIASRLFKIKGITEKPRIEQAKSNLAIVGRYILTSDVFEYLKSLKANKNQEIILADAFSNMILDGKIVYGYNLRGKWLECGTKENWIKTFLYFASNN